MQSACNNSKGFKSALNNVLKVKKYCMYNNAQEISQVCKLIPFTSLQDCNSYIYITYITKLMKEKEDI